MLAAEINRRKEPLEAYPIDSMAMVGSVLHNGQPYALLKVDNLLYQVKQGDYLGQNYGKITKISETNVAYSTKSCKTRRANGSSATAPSASGEAR